MPVGKKPDAIPYEPLTKHVFALNGDSDDATVIDPATAKVVASRKVWQALSERFDRVEVAQR